VAREKESMREALKEEFFKANEEYSQALEELRQLVHERFGTPEKPKEPTLETLERLHSLVWQAKEAYDRMVELHGKLMDRERGERRRPSFGPRLPRDRGGAPLGHPGGSGTP